VRPLDRRPAFWIAYVVAALASIAIAWQLFPLAIPLVNLDITMSRHEALAKAEALASERQLVPAGTRSAARFAHDDSTQNYIELEGGGKAAFARLVAGNVYAPYWWEVRLFKPGEINEAWLRFRPDGRLDGFTRRVAETYVHDPARKALTAEAALALAREQATRDWGVDLTPYRTLNQSQQTRQTGRVDHSFVFEHEQKIADARIRLSMTVSGDELTELVPFVFVPETFERRFQELRSANNAIAGVAGIVAGVLYGLGGCILGSLWLLRRHWLVWRPALAAGFVISGLLAAALLAGTPTAWFSVSTAQPESAFWLRQIGLAVAVLFGGGLGLAVAFAAAEGLTRRAFPDHPQLWRVWSRDAAGAVEIAGRTAGGYLFVPIELALIAAFYFATNRWLGWWQPSEALTDPNILSSLVPALTPIGLSLQAGALEECVFRAVPLALGALIGSHFGKRRLGIAIAFIVQAVIFGAAHANYPGLPSYSRLVELLLPSLLWAAIFLRYGLVPTILLHALFDLVLFSIPLFLIDAPGAALQRSLVIIAALVPAGIVIVRRIQAGAWRHLPEALWNRAWQPVVPTHVAAEPTPLAAATGPRAALLQRALPILGLAGLAAWFAFTSLGADAPPLVNGRADAIAVVERALQQRGVTLGPEWKRFATVRLALDDPTQRLWHGYVWREAGPAAYRALLGGLLAPPLWEVRFARFEGDVAERAEEWRATVDGNGVLRQIAHRIPEGRPGPSLDRAAALAIAERSLQTMFGVNTAAVVLRTADEADRPARRDWVFAFGDPKLNVGANAEARYQVLIAGDEVIAAARSVFIPEAWQRTEVERDGTRQLVKMVSGAFIGVSVLLALVYAVIAWTRRRYDRRALRWVAIATAAMLIATSINSWPTLAMQLRTAEPIPAQLATSILGTLAGALVIALLFGLLAGVAAWYARSQTRVPVAGKLPPAAVGVAAALATAGIAAALTAGAAPTMPLWPDLRALGFAWSWGGAITAGLGFIPVAVVTLFLLCVVDRATSGWTRRIPLAALALMLFGFSLAYVSGQDVVGAVRQGVIEGLTTLIFAWLVLRYDMATVPAFVATGLILDGMRNAMLSGTPEAWGFFAITAAVTIALAWAVTRYITRPLGEDRAMLATAA
jgi:membrane protease YdiL (CAAX protease family)